MPVQETEYDAKFKEIDGLIDDITLKTFLIRKCTPILLNDESQNVATVSTPLLEELNHFINKLKQLSDSIK